METIILTILAIFIYLAVGTLVLHNFQLTDDLDWLHLYLVIALIPFWPLVMIYIPIKLILYMPAILRDILNH